MSKAEGRQSNGQWAKGNSFGAGTCNGSKQTLGVMRTLRQACSTAISVSDVRKLMRAAYKRALKGDMTAARLVLEYAVGKAESLDVLEQLDALQQTVDQLVNRKGLAV